MLDKVFSYITSLGLFGWLEIAAAVFGFFYVYLEIRKSHYLWYFCLVSSVLNIFVYSNNHYLAMTILQFYYIVTAIYGLYQFRKIKYAAIAKYGYYLEEDGSHPIPIRKFNWKTGGITIALGIIVFFILAPIVKDNAFANGSPAFQLQPYCDTLIAVGSMVGTFFLSKSYICQWYIWIVLDSFSVWVFIMSGMYWMALLYVCYVFISISGVRNWKKKGVYLD